MITPYRRRNRRRNRWRRNYDNMLDRAAQFGILTVDAVQLIAESGLHGIRNNPRAAALGAVLGPAIQIYKRYNRPSPPNKKSKSNRYANPFSKRITAKDYLEEKNHLDKDSVDKRTNMPYSRKAKIMHKRRRMRRALSGRKRRRVQSQLRTRALKAQVMKEVKAMLRKERRKKHESTLQTYKHNQTFVEVGTINANTHLWVPCFDGNDASYGICNIIDSTMPSIDGAVVSYKDLCNNANAGQLGYVNIKDGTYLKVEFANNYNYPVYIDQYYCYCKDNTSDPTTPIWDYEQVAEKTGTLGTVLQGNYEDQPTTSLAEYRKRLGHWTVSSKRRHILAPGGVKVLMMKPGKKRGYSLSDFHEFGNDYQKGVCFGMAFEFRGAVSHDFTDPSLVGYSDYKLDCVVTRCIKYTLFNSQYLRREELSENLDTLVDPELVTMAIDDVKDVEGVDPA